MAIEFKSEALARGCEQHGIKQSYRPAGQPHFGGIIERLIGTIRREFLDHVLFWSAADLEAKLGDFQQYYNGYRTHSALAGNVPLPESGPSKFINVGSHRWRRHCGGLYQTPIAA